MLRRFERRFRIVRFSNKPHRCTFSQSIHFITIVVVQGRFGAGPRTFPPPPNNNVFKFGRITSSCVSVVVHSFMLLFVEASVVPGDSRTGGGAIHSIHPFVTVLPAEVWWSADSVLAIVVSFFYGIPVVLVLLAALSVSSVRIVERRVVRNLVSKGKNTVKGKSSRGTTGGKKRLSPINELVSPTTASSGSAPVSENGAAAEKDSTSTDAKPKQDCPEIECESVVGTEDLVDPKATE